MNHKRTILPPPNYHRKTNWTNTTSFPFSTKSGGFPRRLRFHAFNNTCRSNIDALLEALYSTSTYKLEIILSLSPTYPRFHQSKTAAFHITLHSTTHLPTAQQQTPSSPPPSPSLRFPVSLPPLLADLRPFFGKVRAPASRSGCQNRSPKPKG